MVGYYLKTVTMAAMVMNLSSSAFGCLEIKGTTFNWARHGNGEITTTDSAVQTCTGPVDEGDNNVDCISGYSLNYDYSDNNHRGPMPITYCNPSNCWRINVPLSCDDYDGCSFDFSTFGC